MNYANYAFGAYLEHSCRYYMFDDPVISDAQYDSLCCALLEQWDEVTHRHKHLAERNDLECGTGFNIVFPPQIISLVRTYPHKTLHEVFDMPSLIFADEWEEKAHHIICTIKYGGVGGKVDSKTLRQVGDILRGHPLKPNIRIPVVVNPLVPPGVVAAVQVPTLAVPKVAAVVLVPPVIKL